MEDQKIEFKCPNCGSDELRAEITDTCRISITENGRIEHEGDSASPEINRDFVYCGGCGQELNISDPKKIILKNYRA